MKTSTKETLKIYWKHCTKHSLVFYSLIFTVVCTVAVNAYYPFLYKRLFNIISVSGFEINSAIWIVWQLLFIGFLNWSLWRLAIFLVNFFQPRVKSDILNSCYEYLQNHSYNFFTNSFAGSLVRKVGRFERSFEDIMDKVIFNLGRIFLQFFIVIIVFLFLNLKIGLIMFGWAIIFVVSAFIFARFKLKYDLAVADADSKVTGHLADTIINNSNLKLFNGFGREFTTFKSLTEALFKKRKLSWDINQINESLQAFLMIILEFVLMYYSVRLLKEGRLTIGDVVLVQTYMVQVFNNIWDLGRYIRDIYERLADAQEMTEIFLTPHEIIDLPNAKELTVSRGIVEFKNINFCYINGRDVLADFNFIISPGERVALIGPSGGGKSTIIKLLLRFFDIQNGSILIDGQNISMVTQESLRKHVALVPQDPILFHRSLIDNIGYARPNATREQIINASKLAHCHEFIMQLKEGYNTFVGERGIKLSGGERQRVAIARAILSDAPILVLDEATSSLDSESEQFIQEALLNLMKNRTTIVIAHRLSTIMKMDRILVMENGHIVEQGKHKELLKVKSGVYQKLWEIQAGGFAK